MGLSRRVGALVCVVQACALWPSWFEDLGRFSGMPLSGSHCSSGSNCVGNPDGLDQLQYQPRRVNDTNVLPSAALLPMNRIPVVISRASSSNAATLGSEGEQLEVDCWSEQRSDAGWPR